MGVGEAMSGPAAGWYSAPDRAGELRYWDGAQWTDRYQAIPAPPPPASPAPMPPAVPQPLATAPDVPGPQRDYASFGLRLGAALLDGVLLQLLLFIVLDLGTYLGFVGVIGLDWLFYSLGRSPGRAIVGIRIIDEAGRPPGPQRGGVRLLMSAVSALALGIGYLAMLWSPTNQTWHDQVAGTYVVRA